MFQVFSSISHIQMILCRVERNNDNLINCEAPAFFEFKKKNFKYNKIFQVFLSNKILILFQEQSSFEFYMLLGIATTFQHLDLQ